MRSSSRTPLFSTLAVAVISLSSSVLTPLAHANLALGVLDSFETGVTTTAAFGGTAVGGGDTSWKEGTLANWQLGPSTNSPNVLATNQSIYFATASNGDPGAASGGPHSGDLAAVFPNTPEFDGYISAAVTGVVAGYIYKISFWLANQIGDDTQNYLRANFGGTIASPGAVIVGGNDLTGDGGSGGPLLPGAIPVPTSWTYYEFLSGAANNDARLSFIGGNSAAGNLIDDVMVEFYAVPEVSSFGTAMGLGLLALGTMGRLRRRAFANA